MNGFVRKCVMVICICISIACAGYILWYYGAFTQEKEEVTSEIDVVEEQEVVQKVEVEIEDQEESVVIPIDFKKLKETNSDVHGWIKIEGTVIDYPIVQNKEDEFYLNRNWKKKWAPEGAIFTQKVNAKDFSDFNTLIYGHQMGDYNEEMFHQLHGYLDEEFMEKHREIIIYTPKHILTYKVFAAVVYDDRHLMYAFDYDKKDGRKEFLDSFLNYNDMRNVYCSDIEVTESDRMITLSTCVPGQNTRRLLIGAVLVDEK